MKESFQDVCPYMVAFEFICIEEKSYFHPSSKCVSSGCVSSDGWISYFRWLLPLVICLSCE